MTPLDNAWDELRGQLRLGQQLTGTVDWVRHPGVTGIGVDLGLAVTGFVDILMLPRDATRWPAVGTTTDFEIWWMDNRPQIRLMPVDPGFVREDFGSWVLVEDSPAAALWRERHRGLAEVSGKGPTI
ncbi:hypothetical protein [Streptomyces sp. MB09-02B]|uniref:hypothetical protein n=1 Tax=Streptomyces sp. MB09-02B TaxID=3028667 RepID=UPI0029ACA2D0|nr:hypothetical protein [Streptomyces sp. MB09-02B]MDX3639988.1 hypothetical protein [Streptomyces sp. MB09-02B]